MTTVLMVNGHQITEEYLHEKMRGYGLPEHMVGGLYRYLAHHISPGSFLCAVLANDLMGAVERSDDLNAGTLKEWAQFLYCELPAGCHGSPESVRAWLGMRMEAEP